MHRLEIVRVHYKFLRQVPYISRLYVVSRVRLCAILRSAIAHFNLLNIGIMRAASAVNLCPSLIIYGVRGPRMARPASGPPRNR
jgi:hypothetical protein